MRKRPQNFWTPRAALAALLQLALVVSLAGAALYAYRRLPDEGGGRGARAPAQATLRIVLRRAANDATGERADVPVQLYSIDVAAARREFEDERRYGQRFEDFVTRRMGARQPVAARLDRDGETSVTVPHGRWWVHATLPGEPELSWRLPVNVSGREQTVELTPANAFTRSKTF